MATLETLKEVLDVHGVAVIPSLLNAEECMSMNEGMWSSIEKLTSEFDVPIQRDDKSTWVEFLKLRPLHSMLVQHYKIGHAQYVWDVRQNPKVVDVFGKIWGVSRHELLTSFTGVSIHFPPEVTKRGWFLHERMHIDQSLRRNTFECVQGFVTGLPVNEGDATFSFLSGSHKFHKELASLPGTEKSSPDWVKLTPTEMDFYKEKGCSAQTIVCPAGSLVLWDSRTVHAGKEPVKTRLEPNLRNVVYVCMTPRKLASSRPET